MESEFIIVDFRHKTEKALIKTLNSKGEGIDKRSLHGIECLCLIHSHLSCSSRNTFVLLTVLTRAFFVLSGITLKTSIDCVLAIAALTKQRPSNYSWPINPLPTPVPTQHHQPIPTLSHLLLQKTNKQGDTCYLPMTIN